MQVYQTCPKKYSRTPEIETADLSQSHAGLNLSQFQTDCLLRINSSAAILNYFELFETKLSIVTTLTNKKYWYFTLFKTFINWYVKHSLYLINDECTTWPFKNLFNLFRALNACLITFGAVLEFL